MSSLNFQNAAPDTSWVQIVRQYNHPDPVKSRMQFFSNLLFYSLAWFLMYESFSISYWITLALSVPAAGMLVRLFIIYHDLGHGSFFKSQRLSNLMGIFLGILTFTPYYGWSTNHHIHHLSPLIPNYNLSRCHHENALFNGIKPLGFWPRFKTVTFRLWNERTQEMISFRKLRFG